MKTFSIAFFVFGLFHIAQAQFASVEYTHTAFPVDPHEQPAIDKVDADTKAERYADHSQIAVRTLTAHLAREVDYPVSLSALDMEKTIQVLVVLDRKGSIQKWTYKGEPEDIFRRQIDVALSHFGQLPFEGGNYLGGSSLLIPIRFSVR